MSTYTKMSRGVLSRGGGGGGFYPTLFKIQGFSRTSKRVSPMVFKAYNLMLNTDLHEGG